MPIALNKENTFYLVKELLWLTITALIAFAVLYPITQKIDYLYYGVNFAFVFITLTYFRYTLAIRSLPFLHPPVIRFLLFTINLSLFIYFMQKEQQFLILMDNFYTEDFGFPKVIMYDHIKENLFKYLYTEIVLFGTGSLIMIAVFNLRLIVAWWQLYKHKANNLLDD